MSEAIFKAIVQAQTKVRSVGKDKENTFSRYKYTSAEAMIEAGRKILTSCGLAFVERQLKFSTCDFIPRGDKGGGLVGRIDVIYDLIHESGASMECLTTAPVVIEKGRPDDKAEAAARTYALAYALRGLLQIDRQGDPDGVGEEEEVDERNDAPEKAAPKYNQENAKVLFAGLHTLKTEDAMTTWASAVGEALRGAPSNVLARAGNLIREHSEKIAGGDVAEADRIAKAVAAIIAKASNA